MFYVCNNIMCYFDLLTLSTALINIVIPNKKNKVK